MVTQDVQYTYDMFGNLIGRKLTTYSGGSGTTTISRFVYDPTSGQMVLAFDGSGNLTDRFLNGPAVDQILADEHYSFADRQPHDAGTTEWFLGDNQGTVRDIVTSSGLIDHSTYDAFGKLTGKAAARHSDRPTSSSPATPARSPISPPACSGTTIHRAAILAAGTIRRLQRWMSEDPIFPAVGAQSVRVRQQRSKQLYRSVRFGPVVDVAERARIHCCRGVGCCRQKGNRV